MLGAVFRALVMGLVGSSNWQLLTSLIYVSIDTLFQTISSFKNPSHESRWDGNLILNLATSRNLVFQGISEFKNPSHDSGWNGRDLQTDNFS